MLLLSDTREQVCKQLSAIVVSLIASTVNLTHSLDSLEKGISIEGFPRSDWPVGVSVGVSGLLINIGGPSPLWEAPFPVQMILGCIKKLVKHEPVSRTSQQHSSILFA